MQQNSIFDYIDIHTHSASREDVCSIRNYSAIEQCAIFEPRHSIGLHPYDVDLDSFSSLDSLLDSKPMAIGETGLDYSKDIDKQLQIKAFEAQVQIASTNSLPLIIHCVRAIDPTLAILKNTNTPIIIHGFTGHYSTAKRFIDRGYFLSFGARTMLSPKTIETLKSIPQDRVFIETDDAQIQIQQLYTIFAEFLGTSVDGLKQQMYNNFNTIFHL